jgi:hypothetical protein
LRPERAHLLDEHVEALRNADSNASSPRTMAS